MSMQVHLQPNLVWDHIDEAAVDVLVGELSIEPWLQSSGSTDDTSRRGSV